MTSWYWKHCHSVLPATVFQHPRSLSAEPLRSQDALSHMLMFTLHSSWELQSHGRMLSALPLPLGLLSICGKAQKDLLLLRGDSFHRAPSLHMLACSWDHLRRGSMQKGHHITQCLMGDSVVLMKGLYRPLSADEATLLTGPGTGSHLSGAQNVRRLGFLIRRRQGVHTGRH